VEIQKLEKEEFKESKKEKAKRIGFWVLKILAFLISFGASIFIYWYGCFLFAFWIMCGLFILFLGLPLFTFFFFKCFFQKIEFWEFCEEKKNFLIFLFPVISIFSFLFSTFSPLFSPALSIFKIKETYFTVQLCFTSLNLIGFGLLTRKLFQNYKIKISFIVLVILAFPFWVMTLLMPPNVVIHFWLYTAFIAVTWVFYTQKFFSKKKKYLSLLISLVPLMMISLFVVCDSISIMGIVYISAKNAFLSHFSLEKKTPAGERIYAIKEVGDPYQHFLHGFFYWLLCWYI
jgi:fatty acid desaturase